jgi:hypothetical protein
MTPKHEHEHEHDDQDDLGLIAGEVADDDPDVVAGMLRLERLRADEGEIAELGPGSLCGILPRGYTYPSA